MDNSTIIGVTATRLGAAPLGARSPWTAVTAAGANRVLGQALVLAGGAQDARRHAPSRPVTVMNARLAQLPQSAAAMAAGPRLTTDNVNVVRKPKNVHKTRSNAGGYGAMGPYPERERLA